MAIAIVAGQNISASGTYNITAGPFNNTVGAGNTILIAIVHNDNVNHRCSSVTDSAGSTYSPLGTVYTANGLNIELWGCFSVLSSGSPTQTIQVYTYQTGDAVSFIAQELTGFANSVNCFDAQTGVGGTATTSLTTPAIITNNATEILLGVGAQNNTNRPYSAGAGFTMINQLGGVAGIALEYQIISSQGSYTAGMTIDTAQNWELAQFALSATAISTTPFKSASPKMVRQAIQRGSLY